jgi:hypothetical protein
MDEILLFSSNSSIGNHTQLSQVDIVAGTLGSFGSGICFLIFILPLPILTQFKSLRKKTLFEFENAWLPLCTVSFLILPIVLFFAILPVSNIKDYVHSSVFSVADWVPGLVLICAWCTLGLTCYALAVDYVGLMVTNSMVLPVCVVVSMFIKMLRLYRTSDLKSYVFVSGQSIMFWIVLVICVIAFIIAFIGAVFKERSTREQRKELAQNVEMDIKNMNSGKAAKEKKEKTVSTAKVVFRYYLGLGCAVMSACSFYLLPLAFTLSYPLFDHMQTGGNFSLFQCHTALLSFGLFFGYIPSFLIAVGLLLVNRTIKKYAICSGGIISIKVNFKVWRVLSLLVTLIMGVCLAGALFLQWCIAEVYMGNFNGDYSVNSGVWNLSITYLTFAILSIPFSLFPLLEFKKTRTPERVLIPISCAVSVVALCLSCYFAYPTKWHVL